MKVGILVKKLLFVLIVLGGGIAGLVYYLQRPRTLAVEESLFTFATVQRGTMHETISATGILQPRELVIVVSELPGTVTDIAVRVNDVVKEGDPLCRLDDAAVNVKWERAVLGVEKAKAALAQAQALEHAADVKYQWELKLEKEKFGAVRADREEAELRLKAAKAGVLAAQVQLDEARTAQREVELSRRRSVVQVPSRQPVGPTVPQPKEQYLVIDRKVHLGQFVGPTAPAPLFTLAADLGRMEVHAEVAEGDIGRVKKGLQAVFTVSALGEADVPFQGVVKEIRPVPNNIKGAVFYTTIIEVVNQKDPQTNEWRLRPGMTAAVDIIRRAKPNVWKVPTAALSFQLEEPYQSQAAKERLASWKQRDDHADWKTVWIWDAAQKRPWPIFVRLGRDGQGSLKDNEFIEVLEWESGQEPAEATKLKVITGAPPARMPGIFEQPTNIRVS